MSSFLFRLGQRCARHPLRVLAIWLLIGAVVIGLNIQLGGTTKDNLTVPGVEAQSAGDILNDDFPEYAGISGQMVFHVDDGTVTEPTNTAAIESSLAELAEVEDVTAVSNPFDARGPTISADGKTAFSTVYFSLDALEPTHTDHADEAAEIARDAGIQTELGGGLVAIEMEGNEAVGLIVAVIVLLVAFGSLIAMAVPIVTALFALGLGLSGLGVMAYFVNTPVTSTMLASMIGLGVGIDYALFIVTRHRQNLTDGMSVEDAAGAANATAGQSVLFAGMTVVIAITGLVMAGMPAMTAMGFAAAIVVIFAMLIAVTLLPACLGFAGRHIDRWSIPHRKDRGGEGHQTFAGRWAHHVGKRPWRYAILSFIALVVVSIPVLDLQMGFSDDSNTAKDSTEHKAFDLLSDGFGRGFNGAYLVIVDLGQQHDQTPVDGIRAAIAGDAGVAAVQPALISDSGRSALIAVQPTTGPQDDETSETLTRLRDDVIPTAVDGTEAEVFVGGRTALMSDLSDRISERLIPFILAVVALSFLLLMLVFRSVMVPLKAAIMNMLSIGAAYGVIVAVFQWGWGKGLIGLDSTVPINPFVPMIMFAVLFGLSMDYEVFLLSRVREEYQRTRDSHQSVVDGLASTARVITSAALIMISVFLAFVMTDNVTVKMFGLGLATAVAIDATVVRMVLVPSTMSLLGSGNWWLPRWLDRILPHMDLEGGDFSHLTTETATTAITDQAIAAEFEAEFGDTVDDDEAERDLELV
ncbi:MAG TPA: MMPL family transporter [Ilumatobacter sp.]|jgi:RND superfamily putative drug exporter|nr:MMPL family transporter [Ilumatobacter sp.]